MIQSGNEQGCISWLIHAQTASCAMPAAQVRGSILIGMACTALAFFAVNGNWPTQLLALPSLRFFDLDFSQVLALDAGMLSAVMAYVLVMIFDIGGAIYGTAQGLNNIVPGEISLNCTVNGHFHFFIGEDSAQICVLILLVHLSM